MTGTTAAARITATPAAREAVARLTARGGPVMFVQSAGCCGGNAPMCFRKGEFLAGESDVLLGEIEGCPFYLGSRLYQAWGEPDLILDVAPGFAEGFSLPAGEGLHFVSHPAT